MKEHVSMKFFPLILYYNYFIQYSKNCLKYCKRYSIHIVWYIYIFLLINYKCIMETWLENFDNSNDFFLLFENTVCMLLTVGKFKSYLYAIRVNLALSFALLYENERDRVYFYVREVKFLIKINIIHTF